MATAAVAALLVGIPAGAAPSGASNLPAVEIPNTKFVLKNGLTLIVHEDHKAPIVAVNLWYHVGSKNEPAGRTGFAHLFEHLMFGGKNGNQKGWFEKMEAVGATDLNGTTYYGCAGHQRVRGAQELAIDVYLRCSLTSPFGPSDPRLHWKLAVQTESVSPPELPKIGRSV
jgi:hypothetical protein